jgi:hypothetical protein
VLAFLFEVYTSTRKRNLVMGHKRCSRRAAITFLFEAYTSTRKRNLAMGHKYAVEGL